jgi:hypothetical protein
MDAGTAHAQRPMTADALHDLLLRMPLVRSKAGEFRVLTVRVSAIRDNYAFALNPSLDINQYAHTAWTVRDGFFKGSHHLNCSDARRLSLARHGIRLASLRWRSERPMAAAGG